MDINKFLAGIPGPPAPPELAAIGWTYMDPPTSGLSPEHWQEFLSILGEGEFRIIASSQRTDKAGHVLVRGQFWVSPKAMQNLKDWKDK